MQRRTFLTASACAGLMAASQSASAATLKILVDKTAGALLSAHPQSVGFSVGVYNNGNGETFAYGTRAPGKPEVTTPQTLYPIASITKTFAGILMAQAALAGKLKLDDDIRTYMRGDYPNLAVDGRPVLMRDLLDHRSGLPFFIPQTTDTAAETVSAKPWTQRVAEATAGYSRDMFFAELRTVKLAFKPDTAFGYSNAGSLLAGYLLEDIEGKPFEALLKDRILGPLGMRNTAIALTPAQAANAVSGYERTPAALPGPPAALQAAGAMYSTADDMLKYLAWNAEEKDPAVNLSHQPVFTTGGYSAGLNWQILTSGDRRIIWQSGNIGGFHAYCVFEPGLKIGVVALFNQADEDTSPAHNTMVNALLAGMNPGAMQLP